MTTPPDVHPDDGVEPAHEDADTTGDPLDDGVDDSTVEIDLDGIDDSPPPL